MCYTIATHVRNPFDCFLRYDLLVGNACLCACARPPQYCMSSPTSQRQPTAVSCHRTTIAAGACIRGFPYISSRARGCFSACMGRDPHGPGRGSIIAPSPMSTFTTNHAADAYTCRIDERLSTTRVGASNYRGADTHIRPLHVGRGSWRNGGIVPGSKEVSAPADRVRSLARCAHS